MVSGVWNQLLFLGQRIDGFVHAGESGAALPSAHLALNILQHNLAEDGPVLGALEADRLRELLMERSTQEAALRRLVDLTRGSDVSAPVLPALWRSEKADEAEKKKLIWTWRQGLGSAVFRALRYQHTRYSPTGGQSSNFLFRVSFDPREGLLQSVELPHFYPEIPVLQVSENEACAFFVYSRDLRRLYLSGHLPELMLVSGSERDGAGERGSFPDLCGFSANVRSAVEALHGSEPLLPQFKIHRRRINGAIVHEMDPSLYESNARYARKVLPSPNDAVMSMTIRWSDAMTRAARSGSLEELNSLFPSPEIFVSVGESGAFVGFVYAMPDQSSPRGTVYEIGSPDLGLQARLRYEIYRADRASQDLVRVPVGVRWLSKPNRLQRRAIERWITREEFQTIRNSWILDSKPA